MTGGELKGEISKLNTPWMRNWVAYDPVPFLKCLRRPVLALAGRLDLQVPSNSNLPPLTAALTNSNNPKTMVHELAGLKHLFQRAVTGSPEEYGSISETIAPEAMDVVIRWIHDLYLRR